MFFLLCYLSKMSQTEADDHHAPFWSTKPTTLLCLTHTTDVWPSSAQATNANLNAVVRMLLCISILARLCGASWHILLLPPIAMAITYAIHAQRGQQQTRHPTEGFVSLFDDAVQSNKHPNVPDALQHEHPPAQELRANTTGAPSEPETPAKRVGGICVPPTRTNPFGNVMITEMQQPRRRACARQDQWNYDQRVAQAFGKTQNVSPNDVFSSHASQRQFFTMPWTAVPNDDGGDFANWLYDTPPILKEQALVFSPV